MLSTRSTLCLPLLITAGLLLTTLLSSQQLCAQSPTQQDVLILKPGERATVGNPYGKILAGARPVGDRRFVFVRFLEVDVSRGDGHVTGLVAPKKIQIHATDTAAPGTYVIRTSILVEDQVYRMVGRDLRWVNVGNRTKEESFTVLVDIEEPPLIYLPVGAKAKIDLPHVVHFTKSVSRSKAVAELASNGSEITFHGKKKGTAKIAVSYTIGGIERSQKWKLKVIENSPTLARTVAVRSSTILELDRLASDLKVTQIAVEAIDPGTTPVCCRVQLIDRQVQIVGHSPGKGTAYLRVLGIKGRKESWHLVPLEIETTQTSTPEEPPAPYPPEKKDGGEKDTEEEDIGEDDGWVDDGWVDDGWVDDGWVVHSDGTA